MAKQTMNFRLNESLVAWLDGYAKRRRWTKTQVVEEALWEFRDRREGGVGLDGRGVAGRAASAAEPDVRSVPAPEISDAMRRQVKLNEAKARRR